MSANLDEAYERLHRHGPEYGGDEEGNNGLTNHGPMAMEVVVRRRLDVDVDRWLDSYVRRLREAPTGGRPITEWQPALGDARRLADWTATFGNELDDRAWQEVLATWWPRLLPGLLAGSTHGLIRVGHAVRALDVADSDQARAELAHGLAFWAARYRALPDGVPRGTLDASAALAAVPRMADQNGPIAGRVPRVATTAGWLEAVQALRRPTTEGVPDSLIDLVAAGGRAYLEFGAAAPVMLVHTATAPNAVRHVLPVLPTTMWAASHDAVWRASAAVLAMYAPARPTEPMPPRVVTDDPDAVLARAADHGDEHVLKFADTLVEAHAYHPDPALLAAAAHARNLIEQPVRSR